MNFNKIILIIQREYLTRVKKKSFLIMTLLGPVIFGAVMVGTIWISTMSTSDKKSIQVIDENPSLSIQLPDNEKLSFVYAHLNIEPAKKLFIDSNYEGLLYIPKLDIKNPKGIVFYSKGNAGLDLLQSLQWKLKTEIENIRLVNSGIDPKILEKIKADITIETINLTNTGEQKKNTNASAAAGYFGAILVYFFIFLYGMQVMRGVIEEKTNRIVEVIITSVKPIELMMGKIIGIAAVALTQFVLWVILTFAITTFISGRFQVNRFSDANFEQTLQKMKTPEAIGQSVEMNNIVSAIDSLNIPLLLSVFLFYFIFSYLLYAALFGAIGSVVDNETDTQQFMLPVTIPLVVAFIFVQTIIREPDSNLAIWLSIIPFTSPIIMMVRLPFGVPPLELITSMALLVATFVGIAWMAARIYRVGILMYGKKPTYAELVKWLFYR